MVQISSFINDKRKDEKINWAAKTQIPTAKMTSLSRDRAAKPVEIQETVINRINARLRRIRINPNKKRPAGGRCLRNILARGPAGRPRISCEYVREKIPRRIICRPKLAKRRVRASE